MRISTLMPLTRYAWHGGDCTPARGRQNYIDAWFNQVFRGFGLVPTGATVANGTFLPRLSIVEDDKAVTITAELPGMEKEDLELFFTDEGLMLKGEKRHEVSEGEEGEILRTELSYGSFERLIPLPVEVDAEAGKAVYKNGVLTLTLPKAEPVEEKVRSIPIKWAK